MAPAKKTTTDPSIDDLLNFTSDDVSVPATEAPLEAVDAPVAPPIPAEPAAPVVAPGLEDVLTGAKADVAESDAEDAELAALRAELEKPSAVVDTRPIPESQLSPKAKEIRDLKDKLAKKKASETVSADQAYELASERDDVIVIHILEDGFTVNGEICYRGRELTFIKGGRAYEQTKDRDGKTWLDLDLDAQFERWGSQKFDFGPWRGRSWDKLTLADLPEGSTPDDLRLAKANAARQSKAAPVFAG